MKKDSIRGRRSALSQRGAIIAAVAGAALLAACGSSHPSASSSPGQPTRQQADAFVHCMQAHGITNFYLSRPGTQSQNGEPPIMFSNYGVVVNVDGNSPQFLSASNACRHLLPGGGEAPPVSAAQLRSMDRAAACMRSHGFPDYPDPDVRNGQLVPNPLPTSIDVNSQQFMAAIKTCGNPDLG